MPADAKGEALEITLLLRANALRLTAGRDTGRARHDQHPSLPAIIDVGSGGTLLGVELSFVGSSLDAATAMRHLIQDPRTAPFVSVASDTAYVDISSHPAIGARSASAFVTAELSNGSIEALVIPRRGDGYEISYPSGNR